MPDPRAIPPAPPACPAGNAPPRRAEPPAPLAAPPAGSAEALRMAALRRVPGGPRHGLRLARTLR